MAYLPGAPLFASFANEWVSASSPIPKLVDRTVFDLQRPLRELPAPAHSQKKREPDCPPDLTQSDDTIVVDSCLSSGTQTRTSQNARCVGHPAEGVVRERSHMPVRVGDAQQVVFGVARSRPGAPLIRVFCE